MPFIAIALAVALALGGGVSVAAEHAQPNDALYQYKTHVNDNVRAGVKATSEEFDSIGASIRGALHLDMSADSDSDTNEDVHGDANAQATTTVGAHGALRIRDDADDGAKAADEQSNPTLNADGSVKVNVF